MRQPDPSRRRDVTLRALGAVAAVGWIAVALDQAHAWPRAGLYALAAAVAAGLSLRPVSTRLPGWLLAPPRWGFVGAVAVAAAATSAWTVHDALGDQVISIDASIYVLQARALAHGHFGLTNPHPVQAFVDRFVLEGPDHLLYGIFPPGWPLALVPFVLAGAPMAAGPAVAVALTLALAALGRAAGRAAGDEAEGELATRVALLLSLASIGRALETAELLSHAFVATLAAAAVAGALDVARDPALPRARLVSAGVGACVAWIFASRLLDGVIVALAVAGVLAWTRAGRRAAAWSLVGAAPFVALLLFEQHAATGAWLAPTQSLYFQRSDWPPTCHRLGFGPDIGCQVEHPGPVKRLGGGGYDLRKALWVTRERAGWVGEDLVGWGPIALMAFVPVAVAASAVDACLLAFVLSLVLAYALFYYGNALLFGARHLFPVAGFLWLLAARGAVCASRPPWARGAGIVVLLGVAFGAASGPWSERFAAARKFQEDRSDLARTMRKRGVDRGILKSHDFASFAASFDPWSGDDRRIVTLDDDSGLVELRRAHPDLPVLLSLPGEDVGRLYVPRPRPGVLVEIERSWPSLVVPSGLGSRQADTDGASGGSVLLLSHAAPGASIEIAFETAVAGTYAVRVDAVAGPDEGDYALSLDGTDLPAVRGFATVNKLLPGAPTVMALPATRHVLVARCLGKGAASAGYDLRLDALVGEPRE